jgi:hypothetical protein
MKETRKSAVLQFLLLKKHGLIALIYKLSSIYLRKFSKKDPEVFKKAIATLSWAMTDQSNGVIIQKKV